jgi:ribosome-associated heat shock protein Hsp15
VRIYRSRSQATAGCLGGHIKIQGNTVKPSREVRAGDVVTAQIGPLTRTLRVLNLLDRRVGASLVPQYLEDLTPKEEYERARSERTAPVLQYPKGWGRPTKKQRRLMEQMRAEV